MPTNEPKTELHNCKLCLEPIVGGRKGKLFCGELCRTRWSHLAKAVVTIIRVRKLPVTEVCICEISKGLFVDCPDCTIRVMSEKFVPRKDIFDPSQV